MNAAGTLTLSPRPFIGTSEYYGVGRVSEIRLRLRSRLGLNATERQGGRTSAHSTTTPVAVSPLPVIRRCTDHGVERQHSI